MKSRIEFGIAGRDDYEKVAGLCFLCMPDAPASYYEERLRGDILPNGVLVAREDGWIVSNVDVFGVRLRFGSAVVRCAGIGNVVTHPDYRRRGLAAQLMKEAFNLMEMEGMPVSILATGIRDYYAKMGYAAWEQSETDLLGISGEGPPFASIRPLDPNRDVPTLNAIRREYGARFVGWHDKTEDEWRKQYAWISYYPGEVPELALVAERGGAPRAYVRAARSHNRQSSVIMEFGALPGTDREVSELAVALTETASRAGIRAFRVPSPCRELIAALKPRAEACDERRDSSFMIKITDLAGFLGSLGSELSLRAYVAGVRGTVALVCGGQSATLTAGDGPVRVDRGMRKPGDSMAVLDAPEWTSVFLGVKPFSAQGFAARSRLGEAEINLLDAIFPRRDSLFWKSDAF